MELQIFLIVIFVIGEIVAEGVADPEGQVPQSQFLFSYGVDDKETGNNFAHQQATDGEATKGQYRVELPDGRTQVVTYTADENGYNAVVTYEGVAVHPDDDIDGGGGPSASTQLTHHHPSTARVAKSSQIRPISPISDHLDLQPNHHGSLGPLLPQQPTLFPHSDLGIDVPLFENPNTIQSLFGPAPIPRASQGPGLGHVTTVPHPASSAPHQGSPFSSSGQTFLQHGNSITQIPNQGSHFGIPLSNTVSPLPHITTPIPTHGGSISPIANPGHQAVSPIPNPGIFFPQQSNTFPGGLISDQRNSLSHSINPGHFQGSFISNQGTPIPQITTSTPTQLGFISQQRPLPQVTSPIPLNRGSFSNQGTSLPHIPRPISNLGTPVPQFTTPIIPVQRGSFGPGSPIPQITSPVPHQFSDLSFHNPGPVTPSGLPRRSQFNPIDSSPQFIPSQANNFLTPRPIRPSPGPFVTSASPLQSPTRPVTPITRPRKKIRVGRRRRLNKSLAPFRPGADTLDREQFLRHKGIER